MKGLTYFRGSLFYSEQNRIYVLIVQKFYKLLKINKYVLPENI